MDADFLLIQKMLADDEDAVEAFVSRYYTPILRFCALRIGDRDLAEDLTQETFERFFRHLESYRHQGKAGNLLYTIAANACRDQLRRRKELPLEGRPEPGYDPTGALELRLSVGQALSALPEELREVAVLYFARQLKQRDIARILGIGLPLVKYRIKRARELLRARLGEEEQT